MITVNGYPWQDLLDLFKSKQTTRYAHFREDIKTHIRQNNLKAAERLAHTMKGPAGNMGAVAVAEIAGRLKSAIATKNDSLTRACTNELGDKLHNVIEGISPLQPVGEGTSNDNSRNPEVRSADRIDRVTIGAMLRELAELLDTDISAAMDVLNRLTPFLVNSAAAAHFRRLSDQLASFDIEAAKQSMDDVQTTLAFVE